MVQERLQKRPKVEEVYSIQYIHRNYHVVKQADMMLALTCFQPESNLCFGGTGWAVEMAKVLKKVLYVYDVQRDTWFWYNPDQDLFYACDQMSEEQYALPTLVQKTAIVGVRNVYDYPNALLECVAMGGYVWLWLAFRFSQKLIGNFSLIFEILGSFCDLRQLLKFSLFELMNFLRLDTK